MTAILFSKEDLRSYSLPVGLSLLIVSLVSWAGTYYHAQAEAPQKGCPIHWTLPKTDLGYAAYKNARFVEYQDMLCDRGITDKNDLRLLTSQLFSENGAVSESRLGDHGCSFGLIQYNACSHEHISAKKFLAKHPEWKSYRFQLRWMADSVAYRYKKYHGNILQIVVSHNRPASAAKNRDTPAGYFATISKKAKLFSL